MLVIIQQQAIYHPVSDYQENASSRVPASRGGDGLIVCNIVCKTVGGAELYFEDAKVEFEL